MGLYLWTMRLKADLHLCNMRLKMELYSWTTTLKSRPLLMGHVVRKYFQKFTYVDDRLLKRITTRFIGEN